MRAGLFRYQLRAAAAGANLCLVDTIVKFGRSPSRQPHLIFTVRWPLCSPTPFTARADTLRELAETTAVENAVDCGQAPPPVTFERSLSGLLVFDAGDFVFSLELRAQQINAKTVT
jgi:hypothetical protein